MSFSIRTVVEIANALIKQGYASIVRRMVREDPKTMRKASTYASEEARKVIDEEKSTDKIPGKSP